MALTLDGNAGLFAKVGAFYKALVNAETVTGLSEEDRALFVSHIRAAAQRYLVLAVQSDTQIRHTVESALNEVVIQAVEQSESCDDSSSIFNTFGLTLIGSGISVFSSGASVCKYNLPSAGARDFTSTFRCTELPANGQNHTAIWQFVSEPRANPHGPVWYRGLGHSFNFRPLSAQTDSNHHVQNQTILANGGMELFTGDVPHLWTTVVGTPGTDFQEAADPYIGSANLEFLGTGTPSLSKIRQQLNSPTGTLIALRPQTHYFIGARMKATASSTGVVRLSIEDSAGNELYSSGVSKDVSTLGTSYENVGFIFYTGDAMGSSNYAVIELTTTLNDTKVLSIDEVVLAPCMIIPGTLRLALLETSSAPSLDDRITLSRSVTRDHVQVVAWDRLFDMMLYDLCMPTDGAGSETIADSISVTTPT